MSDYLSKDFAKESEDGMINGRSHHDENAVGELESSVGSQLTVWSMA